MVRYKLNESYTHIYTRLSDAYPTLSHYSLDPLLWSWQKGQYILGVSPDNASARTPLSDRWHTSRLEHVCRRTLTAFLRQWGCDLELDKGHIFKDMQRQWPHKWTINLMRHILWALLVSLWCTVQKYGRGAQTERRTHQITRLFVIPK